MPYSLANYTGNGATTTFAVPFPFISRDHVTVSVNGFVTPFSWLTDGLILVTPAPANGATVLVARNSSRGTRLVDYQDAAVLTEADLDLANQQAIYIAQEAFDNSGVATVTGDISAWAAAAQASAVSAEASDVSAEAWANAAATSAANAATSAATAVAAAGSIANKWSLGSYNVVTAGQRATIDPNITYDLVGNTFASTFYIKPTTTMGTIQANGVNSIVHIEATAAFGSNATLYGFKSDLTKTNTGTGTVYAGHFKAHGGQGGIAYGGYFEATSVTGSAYPLWAAGTAATTGAIVTAEQSATMLGRGMWVRGKAGTTPVLNHGFVVSEVALNYSAFHYQAATGSTAAIFNALDSLGTTNLFNISSNGSMWFGGPTVRIQGDFSNATHASRTLFQDRNTNAASGVGVIPNGTATIALFRAYNNSNPDAASTLTMLAGASTVDFSSNRTGAAPYLPMTFTVNAAERMRLETSGALLVATATDDTIHKAQVAGAVRGNAFHPSVSTKTSTYAATASDAMILADASGGAFTITLPTAAVAGAGYSAPMRIRNVGASNNVTIAVQSGQYLSGTVDGTVAVTPGQDFLVFSDGATKWWGITPAAAVAPPPKVVQVAVSDETTAITTGTAKLTFRMPYAMTLTEVRASLSTTSSSGNPAVDVNKNGVSIFSTTVTIDAGEKTSTTAATPAVLSTSALADDDEITIDIDTAGTGAKGLKVTLIGT
jgi:hypothetical protein